MLKSLRGRRCPAYLPAGPFAVLVLAALAAAGCASRRPAASAPAPPAPTPPAAGERSKRATEVPAPISPVAPAISPEGIYTEEGNASWYGAPFHGRRASNGEVYDMYKLTAAHRTLPFGSIVRVTNLNNGKSTTVRITDRGPFVANRVIDLSLAAAQEIGSVGPGVVPVRLEVISGESPTAGYFTVQVGAFKDRANAERLRDRLSASYSPVLIQEINAEAGQFFRVRVGKVAGEEAARQFAEQLRTQNGFSSALVFRLDNPDEGASPVSGDTQ